MLHFIGIDLAWAEKAKPNESGIVMLDQAGTIVSAGWAVGIHEVVAWLDRPRHPSDALLFVDAPLVVNNAKGQRLGEKEVGVDGSDARGGVGTGGARKRLAGCRRTW